MVFGKQYSTIDQAQTIADAAEKTLEKSLLYQLGLKGLIHKLNKNRPKTTTSSFLNFRENIWN